LPYFYCEPKNVKSRTVLLVDDEAHHAAHVMRHRIGDTIYASDGRGLVYEAKIGRISDTAVEAKILKKRRKQNEPVCSMTVAQGVLKGSRMDYAVEKLTELGVKTIVPFVSERSTALAAEGAEKLNRWRRITIAALKQSERSVLPTVSDVIQFQDVLELAKKHDLFLLAWEGEKKRRVAQVDAKGASSVLTAVGPEGGFTEQEVESARGAGAELLSLGRTKLRSETASVVLSALVLERMGDI
jgi:16S rRNA (uracil1498-N3)-methyltransferase